MSSYVIYAKIAKYQSVTAEIREIACYIYDLIRPKNTKTNIISLWSTSLAVRFSYSYTHCEFVSYISIT